MQRQGEGEGRPEKGGKVTLHTDRSLLASHMITHTQVGICINMFYNNIYIFHLIPSHPVVWRVCTHAHLMHAGSTMRLLSFTVDKPNSCDRESMYTWHTDKQVGA